MTYDPSNNQEPDTEFVTIFLLKETYQELTRVAQSKQKAVSWVLAKAIATYLEKEQKRSQP